MSNKELKEKMTQIYDSTYDGLRKYVVSKCKNPSDVPDLLQNIYIKFYKRLQKRLDIENPGHYLMKIAKSEVFSHYKSWYRDIGKIPVFSPGENEEFGDIEEELSLEIPELAAERADELWEFIKSRDTLTFQIFVLHFHYDMKIDDVAGALNITSSNVKHRLYRTIKKVREQYNL